MAVEAVVALMANKLAELARRDTQLLGMHGEVNRIRKELDDIGKELDKMRPFLRDADIKQKEDEAVRVWMKDIRDICFDVDDVIDILGQGQAAQGRHGFVERFKRRISDQITRYKVGKEIERIKLNIKGISGRRESYGMKVSFSTQRSQEVSMRSVLPKKTETVITVDDQFTNEERTRDIDEGRQEASSSSRNLQAHSPVSTPPGEPDDGLQEGINTGSQRLMRLIDEEPGPYDGTRDIDEGRLEASSSAPSLQADRWISTLLGESEEVDLQERYTVSQQLIKEEPSPCDGTRDIDEGRQEASPSSQSLQDRRQFSAVLEESEAVGQQEDIDTLKEQLMDINEGRQDNLISSSPWQKRQMSSEAVVPYIVGKLGDLLIQEAQLLSGVREEVEWIKNELECMQCFLKDADSKQNTNALVKKWVSDITDVSYEIEDVIETFIYSQRGWHRLVGSAKRGIREPKTPHKQIEQIKQKISHISRRRETFGINNINEGRQEASSWIRDLEGRRRNSVMFEEPQLVGQHEEFRTVRDQLMTEEQRRRVISIFGIGGSGKTALAKKILNDVKGHFDCHALVYVSQQWQVRDVLERIIKGVAGHSATKDIEKMDEVDLGLMLRDKYLRGKRYLVVLDDIWTREAWDGLILKLPDDGNKSRVFVTTRIRDVALHADPLGHHHDMRLLNDDESWELFMKKIFPGKDPLTACPSELKEKGWKILKKCGGLPLAILVLGGLLATKDKRERAWSKVLESIPESSKQCMDILALSYWDLPPYLKPCFLYFGLFPEDYEIGSGKMFRLWIAEGFIQQKGNNVMEDVAEDYLEELVSRSMIQVARKKSNGSISRCRIHDLLRELSISEARQNNFSTVHNDNETRSTSNSVRRLAVHGNIDANEIKNHPIETLRSILYFPDRGIVSNLPYISSKLLRVMNYEGRNSKVPLPEKLGEFVHLKFLEFPISAVFSNILPSIVNLSSLQTLKVYGNGVLGNLPNTIWNMKELRHLRVSSIIKERPHLSNLTNLQTLNLSGSIVSGGSWIEGLGKLTNLRKLKISLESSCHDTLPYCIEKLCNLRSLELRRVNGPIPPFVPFTRHLDLYKISLRGSIKKLQELPPNLVELSLDGTELEQDAISTLEKLQHLKILKLHNRSYCSKQMICSPGGFPRLELLKLINLPLEEWIVEEGAMISLESVEYLGMHELRTETLPERVRARLKYGLRV